MKISRFILPLLPAAQRDFLHEVRCYTFKKRVHPEKQLFIFFADGTRFHGGMADRLKGIVTSFLFCLQRGIPFRIRYTFPFDLSDYLLPNQYDWQLKENEKVSHNLFEAKFMYLIGQDVTRWSRLKTKRQIHGYANRDIVIDLNKLNGTDYGWGELFKMLFRPTDELKNAVKEYQQKIGGSYVCAAFRFQNLLGDFDYEGDVDELPENAKEALILKCRNALYELQKRFSLPEKILVTSDSGIFLSAVADMPDVYAFPAKNVFTDTSENTDKAHLRTFADFYLLSEGKSVYAIGTKQMYYQTEFSMYAAKLNNIPFERILIE